MNKNNALSESIFSRFLMTCKNWQTDKFIGTKYLFLSIVGQSLLAFLFFSHIIGILSGYLDNILFDYLTPKEHLEIFCDFKGVPRDE